jgi:glucosylceramidase
VPPLTKQAEQLDPALTLVASPWTAPAWWSCTGAANQKWRLQS